MRLVMRCAIWNFWNFSTFFNPSQKLLIWNFQMRFETRYAIWNAWNLKLLQTGHGSCLFQTFRWDLRWDVLFETFETWNFWNPLGRGELLIWSFTWDLKWDVLLELLKLETFQPITGVGYLKLSDETWNKMCSIKSFETWNFSTHHRGWLFETLRWDLKQDMLFEMLETWNFYKHIMGSCLFETFRWVLRWDVLFETFETWNFWNPAQELLIWIFQMRTWNEMCYLKLLKLGTFQPITGFAYLKLSGETWNEMCYLKLLKLFNLF